jgi:3-oxoisoapionate kinase
MNDLLLAFYGDDFTGSTDVLEALSLNGIPTVLFLEEPTSADVARFEQVRALGIAGTSRSMTPEEMRDQLPPIFRTLQSFGPDICQYKVCSTFDSSPEIGSIGQAIDIGQDVFDSPFVPIVVSIPSVEARGRYVVFGNLYASATETTYRIDRHPTMSQHPVTPMTEADLTQHLAKQTDRGIGLFDVITLDANDQSDLESEFMTIVEDDEIVLFDSINPSHQQKIGHLIGQYSREHTAGDVLFSASSSGLNYALSNYWQSTDTISSAESTESAPEVDNILVISGSASPVTQEQINWALTNGFEGIRLDAPELVDPDNAGNARKEAIDDAVKALTNNKSPLLYSVHGPDDPIIEQTRDRLERLGINKNRVGALLGDEQGKITREVVRRAQLERLCVAGGDTSGYVTPHLDIFALEFVSSVGPGSPLCRAASREPQFDGIQVALKGGQVQTASKEADYFGEVKSGGVVPEN